MYCPVVPLGMALVLAAAANPATERERSVLFLKLQTQNGVAQDLADQLLHALVVEAGSRTHLRVVALKEVEAVLTQEQLKMLAGCQEQSCALEIAGALATDEVVVGSLGRVKSQYLLSLSRIQTTDVRVISRVMRRCKLDDRDELIGQAPGIMNELFGPTGRNGRQLAGSSSALAADATGPGAMAKGLRGAGVLGLVLSVPPVLVVLPVLAGVGLLYAYDSARPEQGTHRVTQVQAFMANTALGLSVAGAIAAMGMGVAAVAALVLSWVLP